MLPGIDMRDNRGRDDAPFQGVVIGSVETSRSWPPKSQTRSASRGRVAELEGAFKFSAGPRFIEREIIGYGGMSVVARAFDTKLERDVAIKFLAADSPRVKGDAERLVDEARIASRLEHPYILPVYDVVTDEKGMPLLCMKLVNGETLEDTLEWAGTSRLQGDVLAALMDVFMKVCDAVAFAHSRGVLHCDLKPSNVMTSDFGQVFLMDWGLARLVTSPAPDFETHCEPAALAGTPVYMAPEQLRGQQDRIEERTDVFGLGAILYEILTGQPPHDPANIPDIALRTDTVAVRSPQDVAGGLTLPAELCAIALRALSHHAADRYPSPRDMKGEIRKFSQVVARPVRETDPHRF